MPARPSQTDPEHAELWRGADKQQVGQRIRKLRIERGFTQEALALEPGVARNVLIHVEHGKRGLLFEMLYDLAEELGIPAGPTAS